MTISFDSKRLRRICEDREYAISIYGEVFAEILLERLSDIEAAGSPLDLPTGSPCEIMYKGLTCYKVDVGDKFMIIFSPNVRCLDNLNWSDVNRIKILNIQNYEF